MNASMSGISAQFSGLSPQEMQLMQEKAMQRQATTRMNMGNIGGMIGEFHKEKISGFSSLLWQHFSYFMIVYK